MKRFATSVQHITGQELEVKAAANNGPFGIVEQELEELRSKVEELSEEVSSCKKINVRMPQYSGTPAHGAKKRAQPADC
jgi:hypothetical protein